MKSSLQFSILLVLLTCFGVAQAQSLVIVDSMGNVLTNDTIFITVSVNDYDIQVPAGVENTSGNAIDVNLTRIEEDVMPNTSSFFCWGTCTGVIVSGQITALTPSGSVNVNAGEVVPGNGDGFLFHYDPNFQAGTSLFKFDFFDVNDTTDYASVYISITSAEDAVSIEERNNELLSVYPNPTEGIVNVLIPNETTPSLLRVINLFGQEVSRIANPSNTVTLDLAETPGVYFIELLMSDGSVVVEKLVKR